jgi:ATP-dependent DNA helicase RecQ
MSGKPVAEQEIGFALLQEVVAAETSMSRRKFLLHYFGEFDSETGEGADMDDNVRNQKNRSQRSGS